ncbi:teflon [Haematobia irritans]|uniref:teflon n=1 Tax=Haematobia irritans TaxID=7368 RepID=UPI003F4FF990
MHSALNNTKIDENEFQDVGKVMVATNGIFAIKCIHCKNNNNTFTRWQCFMRHVHQLHGDQIKFQANADLMVYSVEELVNRTTCEVYESEESGVAEDDLKSSDEDDADDDIIERRSKAFKSMLSQGHGKGRPSSDKSHSKKVGALANMSILNALEDCDISLNLVENLDKTLVNDSDSKENEESVEKSKPKENEEDHHMDKEGDESCMDTTLLKRIALECGLDGTEEANTKECYDVTHEENKKQVENLSNDETSDQNVTLTEDNKVETLNTLSNSNKCQGLKNLLSGLEDLEDVDDLLDNIDDSVMHEKDENNLILDTHDTTENHKDQAKDNTLDIKGNAENSSKAIDEKSKYLKRKSILELQLMADLDLDDIDIDDCLEKTYIEGNETGKKEEKEKSDKFTISPKTPKARNKCEQGKKFHTPSPKNKVAISEAIKESTVVTTPTSKTGNKKTPKTSPFVVPLPTKSPKTEANHNKMAKMRSSPQTRNNSKDDTLGKEVNPIKTQTIGPTTLKSPSVNIRRTKDGENKSPKLYTLSPKSTRTANAIDILATPKSKKCRKSSENHEKALAIEEKELVETEKFEQGITEDKSSTMMCSNMEKDVSKEDSIPNSLQTLLNKDLDNEEDLDMLINQLETSTSSAECESVLNKTLVEDESPQNVSNGEEKLENILEATEKKHCSNNLASVEEDVCMDEDMAIFDRFVGRMSMDTAERRNEDNQDINGGEKESAINGDHAIKNIEKVEENFNEMTEKEDEEVLQQKTEDNDHEKTETEKEATIVNQERCESPKDKIVSCGNVSADTKDEDMDDFENLLNDDLSKALQLALGEEDGGLLELEGNDNDSKNHNIMENCSGTEDPKDNIKQSKNMIGCSQKNIQSPEHKTGKEQQKKGNQAKIPIEEPKYQGKFKKTNQKARSLLAKPIKSSEPIINNLSILKEANKIQPILSELKNQIIEKSPKKLNGNAQKSLVPQNAKQQQQENIPLEKSLIKRTAPAAKCFVETNRGERTPLKVEDVFLKQSPKNLGNIGNICTPKTSNHKNNFNSQEKSNGKQNRSLTPKTPEENVSRVSPSTCKLNLVKTKLIKTPTTRKQASPTNLEKEKCSPDNKISGSSNFVTPQNTRNLSIKINRCNPTQGRDQRENKSFTTTQVSPSNIKTPQSSFKLQVTPENSPLYDKNAPQQFQHVNKKSPSLTASHQNWAESLKLPKGITVSLVQDVAKAVPATLEVTPSRSNYCKQNFTETSLSQDPKLILATTKPSMESLIKNVPSSITITKTNISSSPSSRLRSRQASIDIVDNNPIGASKTPLKQSGNLNYNSYAVVRSERKKKVMQRMRHAKKQIFKSMGTDILGQVRTIKSPIPKKAKPSRNQNDNVKMMPQIKIEGLTPLMDSQQGKIVSSEKSQSLQPSPSTLMGTDEVVAPAQTINTASKNLSQKAKEPVTMKSNDKNTTTILSSPKKEGGYAKSISRGSAAKAFSISNKKPLKRRASSTPASDPAKKSLMSPGKEKQELPTQPLEQKESTQTGPTDKVANLLQSDLKQNHLNDEDMPMDDNSCETSNNTEGNMDDENISEKDNKQKEETEDSNNKQLTEMEEKCVAKGKEEALEKSQGTKTVSNNEEAILDELMEQVEEEKIPNEKFKENMADKLKTKSEKSIPIIVPKDYNEEKDLELLDHVGLKIIQIDDIEDFHTLEEIEEIHGKAQQFANICKEYSKVFSSKQAENDEYFKQLLTEINQKLNVDFELCDLKRLVNLIVMWCSHVYSNKLPEKSPSFVVTNKYLQMFPYLPKSVKRIYYCEFCDEHFTTENRYYNHRIIHTGAYYPFVCHHCNAGFTRINVFKTHESTCKNSKEIQEKDDANKAEEKTTQKPTRPLAESELKKSQIRSTYNCAKCTISLNTEIEFKNHMDTCYRSQKRQPKMSTPRPKSRPDN